MIARILPFLLAFIITVVVMSAYSFVLTERTGLQDQLIVDTAPGHAREARSVLVEAHFPNIRSVDVRPSEHLTFWGTCALSAIYLAVLSLVFGGSFAVARRLTRRPPTI